MKQNVKIIKLKVNLMYLKCAMCLLRVRVAFKLNVNFRMNV